MKLKPYLALCRVSNLPTVWTNVLAAVVLSGGGTVALFLLLLLSMSLFYTGGMCLNDLCDAEQDRIRKPFRPIPSGRISISSAMVLTAILFALGLAPFFFLPHGRALPAASLLLLMIVAYDLLHKSRPSSILLMAGCRLMVFVVSALAAAGTVNSPVVLAGLLQFTYILILSGVARVENRKMKGFSLPVIPFMLASISAIDGIVMAFFSSPLWLLAGSGGMGLAYFGQGYVRGD
ncbi:MAG: prenyltransferase [Desulfobacteraceae bacterium]|nr:MAG: prenyltransferase [Desulfobacteraceae bacterium]